MQSVEKHGQVKQRLFVLLLISNDYLNNCELLVCIVEISSAYQGLAR